MCRSAIALFLAASALVFFAAPADAKPGLHAKHHTKHRAQIVHSPARLRPAPPKDPYADYWNDPSRQGFPSWGLTGN